MNQINNDNKYINIVSHILDNDEFNKIKNIEHHGVSRYDHSLKVSYYSYKIAKLLKLDFQETARGGLLHDFFLSSNDRNTKERLVSTFNHSKKAVENASLQFNVTPKEIDIIKSHMFPLNATLPKYAESWVVNIVDKVVGAMEFSRKFKYKFSYLANLYLIFLINSGK